MQKLLRPPSSFGSASKGLGKLLVGALLLFVFCGLQGTAIAQDGPTVAGTVSDASTGETLPGVNIQVVGTQIGTTTGADGSYEITVPSENATLQFSFVGFNTQTVDVNGRTSIDVTLEPATLTGDEVVVVGYSEQRRADLTGSVEVADVSDLQELSSAQVTEQLQGQLAGVTVRTSGQPGDQPQINIRGFNTFGNNQPLFVVDGVPTQDISFLSSQNIESLQVLKDAGAASQYGARASNGVVVITTSQGGDGEDISVNYSASVGYQVPGSGNVYDVLSPQEQGELVFMAQRNAGQDPSSIVWGDGEEPRVPTWLEPVGAQDPNTDDYFVNPQYTDPGALGNFTQYVRSNQDGTNWFDEITDPALQTSHNLSVGGGGELGNYFTSVSYTNQQGTVMNTSFERYSIRANTEFNVTDNFRVGENLTFTVSENLQAGTLQEGQALGMAYREHSIIPVQDIEGNFAGTAVANASLGNASNPVAIRHRARTDDDEDRRLFGNVFMEVDFLESFTARSNFGADINSGYFKFFTYPTYENSENTSTNAYTEQVYNDRSWTWSNQVTYDETFAQNHNVTVLAAAEAVQNVTRFDEVGRQGYFSFNPDYTQLATGSGTTTINGSDRSINQLLSLVGNVDYNYDSTYLLSLTVRRDGSSKFLENQWGTFPAATAGIRVSNLGPLQDIDWLTDLKIRGGYGIMGNQLNVDPNNAYTLFGGTINNSYYAIGGTNNSVQQGFRQVRIGNPDAKWERNEDINIGVDFAILDGQLEGTVDFYQKSIEDLLYNPSLPATAGAADAPFRNVASMRNRGIDLSLRGSQDFSDDISLSGRLTFTTYNNEIQSIAQGQDFFSQDFRRFGLPVIRNEVGHPISSFYGFEIEGFWQNQGEIDRADAQAQEATGDDDVTYMDGAAPGRFRYVDTNGDDQITDADRVHLGSPHADFSYGLNLNFQYSNFSVSMQLYGEQGKEIWNQTKWWTDFRSSFEGAKSKTALYDSWQEEGDTMADVSAPIQEADYFGFATGGVPNSYFVEDGSYLRVRSLRVGYTLPSSLVGNAGIQSLRLYGQAENLLTITGYSGLDPDIGFTQSADNAGGAGSTNFGIDGGAYPRPQTFTMGVNLSF
jgi:TonB-linked SusC/RagA family outer membrane protein